MANEHDYDYERTRYNRGYYDEPYYRGSGRGYERSSYRGSGYESRRYNEPYRERYGGYESEPYGTYDYGRYEYSDRSGEPYYRRGDEGRYRDQYNLERYDRGGERGFFERAGDEVRSWFGDEEAERRRRMDQRRSQSFAGRGPRGYRRSDERIREDVNDLLTDDWWVDASDIEVSVSDGVVTLSGRVDTREDKRRVESIVEDVRGVTDVSNQLRVGQSSYSTTTGVTTGAEIIGTTQSRTAKS